MGWYAKRNWGKIPKNSKFFSRQMRRMFWKILQDPEKSWNRSWSPKCRKLLKNANFFNMKCSEFFRKNPSGSWKIPKNPDNWRWMIENPERSWKSPTPPNVFQLKCSEFIEKSWKLKLDGWKIPNEWPKNTHKSWKILHNPKRSWKIPKNVVTNEIPGRKWSGS